MDIVHVDPGYGKVLQSITTGGESMFVENATYNPYSGVAFSRAGNDYKYRGCISNFDFTFEPTLGKYIKKVWSVKFSVYTAASRQFEAGFTDSRTADYPDLGVQNMDGDSYQFVHWEENTRKSYYCAPNGAGRKVNYHAGFHNVSITYSLTADGTGSEITYIRATTICVDEFTPEIQIYSTTSAITPPKFFTFIFPRVVSSAVPEQPFISNVLAGQASYEGDGTGSIPSDDGIPANTPVYRLPLGTPVTDFEAGEDGMYIAKENGQTLLQTVNTSSSSSLVTAHGNRPINHIVAYGNPGYRVGTAVTAATGISKEGNDITPHGTHTLSFEKDMHVYDVWKIAEGSTFNDINGLQVGWRAGE